MNNVPTEFEILTLKLLGKESVKVARAHRKTAAFMYGIRAELIANIVINKNTTTNLITNHV
jgi:ribosomal protein L25 (general stress protein Ctc)